MVLSGDKTDTKPSDLEENQTTLGLSWAGFQKQSLRRGDRLTERVLQGEICNDTGK